MLRGLRKRADYTEKSGLGKNLCYVIITMHHPHATDEVIDLIASIEIQRQEMESPQRPRAIPQFRSEPPEEALAGEQAG